MYVYNNKEKMSAIEKNLFVGAKGPVKNTLFVVVAPNAVHGSEPRASDVSKREHEHGASAHGARLKT